MNDPMPPTIPLRALIIEDSEDDTLLLQRELVQGGLDLVTKRVETASEMQAALQEQAWDVILADYQLPGFGVPQALAILQATDLDIPLIIVSGMIGEERAVEMMKCGASDYVMKGNLRRLPQAIRRELLEVAERRERRRAEEALRISEEQLRLALECGRLGIWDYDLREHKYIALSDLCKATLGLSPEAALSQADIVRAIHPDDQAYVETTMQEAPDRQDYQAVYRVLWRDGTTHWIDVRGSVLADNAGRPIRLIGTMQDITERKRVEQEKECYLLEAQARADRDPLTELLNHRVFQRKLEEEAARAQQENSTLAVVMLDLDNFKFFNDAYGHAVGDHVLRKVARRLQTLCGPQDILARFGGDEFALLLPGVGGASRKEIEERLQAGMAGLTFCPEGQLVAIPITICFGIALFPYGSLHWHEVVDRADERLRRAKTSGSGETVAYEARTSALNALEGFSMLDALVTAVDNKDRYTRRHSEDVLSYSLMIARQLGFSEEQQQNVAVSALLHDVGKIGVPDAILRKPGKLTEEEFKAIQQHPQMGAIMVAAVPGLEATLDAVRHHHERWDGNGYPFGLRGEETPLIARLMAVADAFSAMTTDRPYRSGMDHAKALSILHSGAGTQWDPACVEAFAKALARTD